MPPRPATVWQRCAGQDEICRFSGQALVRYGTEGQYRYKVVRNRVICDHEEFGDPAYGRVKQCDYNFDLSQREGFAPGNDWLYCGAEGDNCRFEGAARVRYGVDNNFAYRNASGGIRCSVDVFGDPAYGRPKTCDYQLNRSAGNFNPDGGWDYCASEGGTCSFSGPGEVRYGVKGKFVARRAINGMPCSVEAFGSDPAFGQSKHCFVRALGR